MRQFRALSTCFSDILHIDARGARSATCIPHVPRGQTVVLQLNNESTIEVMQIFMIHRSMCEQATCMFVDGITRGLI